MLQFLNAHRAGFRKFGRRLAALLTLALAAQASHAARILVLDMNGGFAGVPSNLQEQLEASGHTVTVQSVPDAPPATLSTASHDQVWVFGNNATPANYTALNTALKAYLAAGGAVYMQSEVSCCNNLAAAAEVLMKSVGNDTALLPGFAHSVIYNFDYPAATVNPALAPDEQVCVPQLGGELRAYRRTDHINVQNQLVIGMDGATSRGPAVVFLRADDMTSGQGALIVNGDRNLLSVSSGQTLPLDDRGKAWVNFFAAALANTAHPGGTLCKAPPSPAAPVTAVPAMGAWALLALTGLMGVLGSAARRRRGS